MNRTENPRVGGSISPLAAINSFEINKLERNRWVPQNPSYQNNFFAPQFACPVRCLCGLLISPELSATAILKGADSAQFSAAPQAAIGGEHRHERTIRGAVARCLSQGGGGAITGCL